MSERRSIEVSADTVDEAIQQGLAELGVQPWDVMVEVIDEPSVGMFGTPPRKAKVRLQLLRTGPTTPPPTLPRLAQPDAEARRMQQGSAPSRYGQTERRDNERRDIGQPRREGGPRDSSAPRSDANRGPRREGQSGGQRDGRGGRDDRRGGGRDNRGSRDPNRPVSRLMDQPASGRGGRHSQFDDDSLFDDLEDETASLFTGYNTVEEADYDGDVSIAREMLVELLTLMDIPASVQVSRVDSSNSTGPWILNVQGQGRITRLIGRRGDTLSSLQYLLRLMVSHKLQHRVNLILDVDGYKAKRAERLRTLANRMADQAISEGRTVVMEPMPPHERRLIHIALRGNAQVTTKSIGEGDLRKVTIVPSAEAIANAASAAPVEGDIEVEDGQDEGQE
ncbi:MAG: Jag N-terminal domain-containing protein [Anaerolineae bacterium]|jgi:spoIIIJ-associated protein|nr:Jag N-terminal domain-containing protein [Anaerolineae bacterium]